MTASPNTPELRARGIFAYETGTGPAYGDIMRLQFALQRACPGGDVEAFDKLLATLGDEASTDKESLEAGLELADIVGRMFDLPAFEPATGAGLSTQERIELVGAFLAAIAPDPAEADGEADGTDSTAIEPAAIEPAGPDDPGPAAGGRPDVDADAA